MIKLIVGLGNPGQQYERTRHNAGFLFLDRLVEQYPCVWSKSSQFHAELAEFYVLHEKLLLIKPQTYMNLSGQSVGQIMRYYKFTPEQILIAHDELDFAPGVLRLKKGGGHAGHNGLRDIISHLNSNNFFRLRIGIGRPLAGSVVADYVLSAPSKQEQTLIDSALVKGVKCVEALVKQGVDAAMAEVNKES